MAIQNPNNLTDAQIKAGYSTIPGAYDPVTGKLKTVPTTPTGLNSIAQSPTSSPNNLTQKQISQGYSTIPGPYDPVTGKLKSGQTAPASTAPTGMVEGIDTSKLTALGVTPEQIAQLSTPQGMDPLSFSSLIDTVKQKLTYNNDLMGQRALIVKHLFDSPLDEKEMEKLPEDVRNVLAQGKDAAELQLRVINDQLQGRAQSLSSSIKDLTSGYQTAVETAEKKKSEAEDNILKYLDLYGESAVPFLKAKYPEATEAIDQLSGLSTLAEKKAASGGSGGGNSNQMTDNERALFTQFKGEPIVKDYNTILSKKLTVDSILNAPLGGPGDLAIVYEFMKGLDPTSVVRETEYESAAKSGNIFAGAFAKFNGYLKPNGGFLPEAVKKSFQSIVDAKLKVQNQLYQNVANEYRTIAERQGLNPENVIVNYDKANVNPVSTNISTWLTEYNYEKDIADAKAAIKNGANKEALRSRLLQKYKTVDL